MDSKKKRSWENAKAKMLNLTLQERRKVVFQF